MSLRRLENCAQLPADAIVLAERRASQSDSCDLYRVPRLASQRPEIGPVAGEHDGASQVVGQRDDHGIDGRRSVVSVRNDAADRARSSSTARTSQVRKSRFSWQSRR
jgi:hypothetical protein